MRPRPIAVVAAALSLGTAGCPMCHNTSHCPKLSIRADWANAEDGAVTVAEAGKTPTTFHFGDDAKTDDVTCNAVLETRVAGFSGGIADGSQEGQPPFVDTIRIGCGRATADRGFVTMFGFTVVLGDPAALHAGETIEVSGGFGNAGCVDPKARCAGVYLPGTGPYLCAGQATVRVLVEQAAGERRDLPKVVSDDFVRVLRVELATAGPLTGANNAGTCTGPTVSGSVRLELRASDVVYDPNYVCPCLG